MPPFPTRRQFLRSNAFGLGSLALPFLLNRDGLLGAPTKPFTDSLRFDTTGKPPLQPGKAQAMISLFMIGGPSHMDLFDPKPQLTKYHLQKFPGEIRYDNAAEASSKVFGSPWKFAPRGRCGTEISELLPHLSEIVDDITLIRSMHTGVNNHGQSVYALHSGRVSPGRPTLGSWLSYALGSETDELPTYLALTSPHGQPLMNNENWTAGWLPAVYQGTMVRAAGPHILNLDPPPHLSGAGQKRQLELLNTFNKEHLAEHTGESDLDARIQSYALAARMQHAAKAAFDLSGEPD